MPDDNTLLRELLAIARTGDPDGIWAQASDNTLLRRLVDAFKDAADQVGGGDAGQIGYDDLGSVSSDGSQVITLTPTNQIKTFDLSVEAGAGPYTHTITISSTNATSGNIARFRVAYAASTNPTVDFVDQASGLSLVEGGQQGSGFAGARTFIFHFNGTNWLIDQWA